MASAKRGVNRRTSLSSTMTRFIYALKEIRACLQAEILTDVQQRLASLHQERHHRGIFRLPQAPTRNLTLIAASAKADMTQTTVDYEVACAPASAFR